MYIIFLLNICNQDDIRIMKSSFITVALAGAVTAFTPPGFEPASSQNLTVAFGSVLAVNGVNLPMAGALPIQMCGNKLTFQIPRRHQQSAQHSVSSVPTR
jgi:hypothetical protein